MYIDEAIEGANNCSRFDGNGMPYCVPHVQTDAQCFVGLDCSFRVQFYDSAGVARRVGGIKDLSVRPQVALFAAAIHARTMVDSGDGWYIGVIHAADGWIDQAGPHDFKLQAGALEFFAAQNTNADTYRCSMDEGYPQ